MKVLKPKALKSGDTLGIVACSTPVAACSPETVERAYQRLRERGFKLDEAPKAQSFF